MKKKDKVSRDLARPYRGGGDPTDPVQRALLPMTDVGAARRLEAVHGPDMMFVDRRGWAVWDGRRHDMQHGETRARRRAHDLINIGQADAAAYQAAKPTKADLEAAERAIQERDPKATLTAAGAEKEARSLRAQYAAKLRKYATTCNNSNRIKNALLEAATLPTIHVDLDQVDADPFVFNAANGRLDLRKLPPVDVEAVGPEDFAEAFGEHRREDRATRIAAADFDPEAACPRFEAFLARIQPDPETRAYIQTVFGMCLSGSMSAQAAFLLRGEGANGKSTLMTAIAQTIGDYATPCPIETFLRDANRSGSSASPDLARLPGARLIQASEPEAGAVLSEGRLKAFSGGEAVTARELHGRIFDFRPTGKIFLSFNRTPQIKADDDGTWRRLKIIPFPVQIPIGERRPMELVLEEFAEEAPGILNWMLEGWRRFAAEGLHDPPEVADASREMRESFDLLGQFLADCCVKGDAEVVLFKDLRAIADQWFEYMGLQKPTATRLGRMLSEKGFRKTIVGHSSDRGYRGLRLASRDEPRLAEMTKWMIEAGIEVS